MKNNEKNEETQIEHRNYITEEEINVSDLPDEIKKSMRVFNEKLKKYESSEEEDVNLFYEIQQDDVAIADAILTWNEDMNAEDDAEHEEEEEEEQEEEEQEEQEEEDDSEEKAAADKAAADKAATQQQQTPPTPKEESLEDKVRKAVKNNIISKSDLEEILGREADYPNEIIGSITLRKQYLKPFYELK